MSITDIKEHLRQALKSLEDIDADLNRLLSGLGKEPDKAGVAQASRSPRVKGDAPMAQTVLDIVKEQAGQAISCNDIAPIALERGVKTSSDRFIDNIDLALNKARGNGVPVERVPGKPRTWRWVVDEPKDETP